MIDDTSQEFINRHIGPSNKDQEKILDYIGSKSLDQLIQNTVPKNILLNGLHLEDSSKSPIDEDGNSVELRHLAHGQYEKYYSVSGIPHITIVRNPVDRFISCSIFLKRMYGDDIQEAMEDPIMFGTMLQNFPLPQAFNWFRPQMDFLTRETQIWKLEYVFGEEF